MPRERGSTPIEFALGLLTIVLPLALVVLLVAPVFEARNFVRRAAAEGARAGVLAGGEPLIAASAAIAAVADGMDVATPEISVLFCDGNPCSFARGAVFVVEVSMPVRQISELLPIGEIQVRARHSEQVDLYRSRP
ncbi:MAG TPA: hypothetical protein VJQ57_00925 [Acidimicrobiia bacterium]|nr:hypothetical protein [Acidimicrobiia bacterium]